MAALAVLCGAVASAGEVTGVTFASTPTGDAYTAEDEIEVDVTFDEDVTVTGTPTFTLTVGRVQRPMTHDPDNSDTDTLRFVYEVREGDLDDDGVSYGANALRGGRIVSGNPATAVDRALVGIGRDRNQRVDAVAPRVDYVRFTSNSGSDLTYAIGDTVEVTVTFDEPVDATGSVVLILDIGGDELEASLVSPQDGAALVFRYIVAADDEDTNGVSVAANALRLGATGQVEDAVGNAAEVRLNRLPSGSAHRVDGIAPLASGAPRVVSRPRSGGAYGAGEWIEVALTFSEAVVASAGSLTLLVGDRDAAEERTAAFYAEGSSGRRVAFRYRVQPTDVDTDGVSVNANAVTALAVSDLAGNAWDGEHAAMPEQAGHRVDGTVPQPARVDGTPEVTSSPGAHGYAVGDTIDLRVRFTGVVFRSTTDPPAFTLRVGEADRTMAYRDGDGTNALEFRYTVAAGDLDTNGIGWQANALTGSVADAEGVAVDQTVPRVSRRAAHTVDGVAPALRTTNPVRVTSMPVAESYRSGETIKVSVAFSEPVEAVHEPDLTLGLEIGTATRQAALESRDRPTDELIFEYTVQDGDSDDDGIAVTGFAGGRVRDLAGNAATLTATLAAQSGHPVDGSAPAATGVSVVSDPGEDDTYAAGDRIQVQLTFGEDISVSGEPYLLLTVGSLTRRASLDRARPRLLVFGYDVQPGDLDTNGISVAAGALLGGGITDSAGNPVARSLTPLEDAEDHMVDAVAPEVEGVAILSEPDDDEGYDTGEVIEVGVTWDEEVYVLSGTPELLLSIGANSRGAGYVGGGGTRTLRFRYEVQAGDRDDDGISIAPDALRGGDIEDAAGTDWEEDEAERRIPAVRAQPGHRVFARTPGVPVVEGVTVRPPTGDTFRLGDRIEVTVTFDRGVFVTGDPVLTLSIGGRSREALLSTGSGTARLVFAYVVQADDRDDDGISIPPDALRLGDGGTVTDEDGAPAVVAFRGLPADGALRVDGGAVGVRRVWIASTPPADGRYGVGDTLEVRVAFSGPVHVTGNPELTLHLGGEDRAMSLFSGGGTDTLTFRYVVAEGDVDDDGVSIAANALTGGTIEDGAGRPVARDFAALPVDPGHRVDGTVRVTAVTAVAIVSDPARDRTYLAGEAIEVAVTFDGVVHVSGEPLLAVLVGGGTRDAALVSGSGTDTLTFRYVVAEGDEHRRRRRREHRGERPDGGHDRGRRRPAGGPGLRGVAGGPRASGGRYGEGHGGGGRGDRFRSRAGPDLSRGGGHRGRGHVRRRRACERRAAPGGAGGGRDARRGPGVGQWHGHPDVPVCRGGGGRRRRRREHRGERPDGGHDRGRRRPSGGPGLRGVAGGPRASGGRYGEGHGGDGRGDRSRSPRGTGPISRGRPSRSRSRSTASCM